MDSSSTSQNFINVPLSSILISIGVHFTIVVVLISFHFLDGLGLSFLKKKEMKEPYQSFIQVDVVDLPDQLAKNMTQVDMSENIVDKPVPQVKPSVSPLPSIDVMKLPDKQEIKEQLEKRTKKERIEDQAKALKEIQQEAKREQALKNLAVKEGVKGRSKLFGNRLSQGNSAVGMIGTASDQYRALVSDAIRNHFNIYLWQQKKAALTADIYLEVYPTGKVKLRRVVKASADPLFDSAVLQAIDASQPLPVPDDISVLKEGFQITFKP